MSEVRGTVEVEGGDPGSGDLEPRLVAPRAAVLGQTHLDSLVKHTAAQYDWCGPGGG